MMQQHACRARGILSGLNLRGARSMGRYSESRSRGAPTPSARRRSATVRMPTQPASPASGAGSNGPVIEILGQLLLSASVHAWQRRNIRSLVQGTILALGFSTFVCPRMPPPPGNTSNLCIGESCGHGVSGAWLRCKSDGLRTCGSLAVGLGLGGTCRPDPHSTVVAVVPQALRTLPEGKTCSSATECRGW